MEKSGAARVKQVYSCCALFSVTHFKQRVYLLYLLAAYFALAVKYTVLFYSHLGYGRCAPA